MAEYVQVAKRALKHLSGHGGVRGAIWQLLRVNDLKTGTLVGVDKYGNKYYEDKRNFFGRHRWVIYTTEMNGKNTFWEVDGSMVPPEWHRWLHSMTDDPPTTHPPVAPVPCFCVSSLTTQCTGFRLRPESVVSRKLT
uniref:NADH dehydrogenase [ubiquinone] 1 alpha subcomplex subunit 12 n=1 Tax=Cairina moschata TaxID=8855 RepID=A0A8C3BL11_CAIMO